MKLKLEVAQNEQDLAIENLKNSHYQKQTKTLKVTISFCMLALVVMTLIPKRKENTQKNEIKQPDYQVPMDYIELPPTIAPALNYTQTTIT